MTSAEIGNFGERHATAWLTAKGFGCYRNTQLPGSTDIEATSGNKSLLVQVKTAISPSAPAILSTNEKSGIVSRAQRNSAEAWLAQVSIDGNGNLVGEIKWTRLN